MPSHASRHVVLSLSYAILQSRCLREEEEGSHRRVEELGKPQGSILVSSFPHLQARYCITCCRVCSTIFTSRDSNAFITSTYQLLHL
ncbi:hypothetical protein EJ06DRAFT_385044 [Trichodelitschia bisporula]|uniref:Uncharacterized protein n=1 Tax=Trichodelitschia bisporula TaxID=703511 RepID=A0A6G1HZX4_9PEZI|nr:hypothetical protein EJ06DRAFT_385044 [Trichodelitschia bisporula]